MPNINAAFGFQPVRHISGNDPRTSEYNIDPAGYASSIFSGDLVSANAAGYLEVTGITGNAIGVFAGCSYTDDSGNYIYSEYYVGTTTGTNFIAYVYDDPYTIFKVQSSVTIGRADFGKNAPVDPALGGSTLNGRSGQQIGVVSGTATNQLRILRLAKTPGNSLGANAVVEVLINQHSLKSTTGT